MTQKRLCQNMSGACWLIGLFLLLPLDGLAQTNVTTNATVVVSKKNIRKTVSKPSATWDKAGQITSNITHSVISVVASNGTPDVGLGCNLHWRIGPVFSQQLRVKEWYDVAPDDITNGYVKVGLDHDTFFDMGSHGKNHEQFGVFVGGHLDRSPKWVKVMFFNADQLEWSVAGSEDVEMYYNWGRHYDWKNSTFMLKVSRPF